MTCEALASDNNGAMPRRRVASVTRHGAIVRSTTWNGVRYGDDVVVNGPRERRQHWTFVAFAVNEATGEEWVEVRGGRTGESKGRSFRPEMIFSRRIPQRFADRRTVASQRPQLTLE